MPTALTFRGWLSSQRNRDDPVGDLARDVFADPANPDFTTAAEWRDHVGHVASGALDTGWKAFRREKQKSARKLRPDVAETAFRVMQEATGQAPKTLPPEEREEKNPEAVKRGRKGGKKGGKVRAAKLTAKERAEVAQIASQARWRKVQGPAA